jgi:D-sedoheptulose 7-phosphate isomerase
MFQTALKQHIQCFEQLADLAAPIEQAGGLLARTIQSGHKILICGNGGSAADAQHFAAELIGRFEQERVAWPAIALTTDTSILTAVGNDYGFGNVFARQVQGLGQPDDLFIGISTSGNSENVLRAAAEAKEKGLQTIGLLGKDGGTLKSKVDWPVVISYATTARVQEAHIFILHFWAMQIERQINPTP